MKGLFICLAVRYSLAYFAHTNPQFLRPMGLIAILIALGFAMIYLFGLRPTGIEAGGTIWWNSMRPLHSLLYGIFAYMAFNKPESAWLALLADAMLGTAVFGWHYLS